MSYAIARSSKAIRMRLGWLCVGIYWVLLVLWFWGRFLVSKPSSQMHGSACFLLQHTATVIIPVDWGLVGVVDFPDNRLPGTLHQDFGHDEIANLHRYAPGIVRQN